MTNQTPTRTPDPKVGTRYILLTRYEVEAGSVWESDDAAAVKNFPRTFIPMKELEDSALDE